MDKIYQKQEQKNYTNFSRLRDENHLPTNLANSFHLLHRSLGNNTVSGLLQAGIIQAKLNIGSVDDKYEKEADQVAGQIMRMQNPQSSGFPAAASTFDASASDTGKEGAEKDIVRLKTTGPNTAQSNAVPDNFRQSFGRSQPLDTASRAFFEPRFGQDLQNVRIHTDSQAQATARSINARAFTIGQDIVFGAKQYSPGNADGRLLIAHELAHVLQQRAQPALRSSIQCQQQPETAPEEQAQPETVNGWIRLVDQAVRGQFGLDRIRTRLTPAHVNILDASAFEQAYLSNFTGSLEERLYEIFMDVEFHTTPEHILRHNRVFRSPRRLREFVRAGIAANEFTGHNPEIEMVPDGEGSFTGRRRPVFRITPRQLLADSVGGFTTTESSRRRRSVNLRQSFTVPTLVHETIHFYTHPRFYNFADNHPDANQRIGDARISQILIEGLTDFFTQQTVAANQSVFGPSNIAYPAEYAQAIRIVSTVGLPQVIRAFFFGDRAQIRRIGQAIEWYKTTHPDLIVPAFRDLSMPNDSEN